MPSVIDPETINVDELPGIWSPVQWELTEDERIFELNNQAVASLMFTIDTPEAALRLFLDETEIERIFNPPAGYDPEQQGEWDENLVTFGLRRQFKLVETQRSPERLNVVYEVEDLGRWAVIIEPKGVDIHRLY